VPLIGPLMPVPQEKGVELLMSKRSDTVTISANKQLAGSNLTKAGADAQYLPVAFVVELIVAAKHDEAAKAWTK